MPFLVQPINRDASLLQHVVLRFASSTAVATSTANVANVHVTTCQSKRCTGVPAEDERALVALSETLTFVPVTPCKFCPILPYFSSPGSTADVTAPAAA
jgi:secreted trypsin-like serine protease